jgi:hypothetical protein
VSTSWTCCDGTSYSRHDEMIPDMDKESRKLGCVPNPSIPNPSPIPPIPSSPQVRNSPDRLGPGAQGELRPEFRQLEKTLSYGRFQFGLDKWIIGWPSKFLLFFKVHPPSLPRDDHLPPFSPFPFVV